MTPVMSSRLPARITPGPGDPGLARQPSGQRQQRPRQRARRLLRLDDLVDEPLAGGGRRRADAHPRTRRRDGCAPPRESSAHPQLAAVDDPDRRPGAHDPELGVRPREHEIGAEVARVHRDVGAAVGLAQHDRQLRHARGGERPHERRRRAGSRRPAPDGLPGMKPGVSTTATSGSPNASQKRTNRAAFSELSASSTPPRWRGWLATTPTGRPSNRASAVTTLRAQRGHSSSSESPSTIPRERLADVVRAPRLRRDDRPGIARAPGRATARTRRRLPRAATAGRRAALAPPRLRPQLVVLDEMADAVALVDARTAERGRVDLLAERVAHDARAGEEHRGVLGHQDEVGERRRVRAAARRTRPRRPRSAGPRRSARPSRGRSGRSRRARPCPPASGRRRTRRTRPPGSGRGRRLEHPHDRVGVTLTERAAEEAAVLRVARDRSAVDVPGRADDPVAGDRTGAEPTGHDRVRDHLEAAGVAQRLEPLERRQPRPSPRDARAWRSRRLGGPRSTSATL